MNLRRTLQKEMFKIKRHASLGRMTVSRIALLGLLALATILLIASDFGQLFSLERLQANKDTYIALCESRFASCWLGYSALYIAVISLSIPGAAVLSLLAGTLFPLHWAIALVSLSSTAGACIAFSLVRYLFHDPFQNLMRRRYAWQLTAINGGIERDGALYLLGLRMTPIFPFFIVNLAMALTPIRLFSFAWISMLGMLPITIVFVYAGRELASIESLGSLLKPSLIAALSLIGIMPLLGKKAYHWLLQKRTSCRHQS